MLYNIGNVMSVTDNTTVSRKSDNAVASSHVLRFLFDTELRFITAQVQASMRDRCYKDVRATKYRYVLTPGSCRTRKIGSG